MLSSEIDLLAENIRLREKNLVLLQESLEKIAKNLQNEKLKKEQFELEIKVVQKQYENLLVEVYKNGVQNHWIVFVFAAEDFNQIFERYKYVQNYMDKMKQNRDQIAQLQHKSAIIIENMMQEQKSKENLRKEETKNKTILQTQKEDLAKLIKDLQNQSENINQQYLAEQKLKKEVEAQIKKALAEEFQQMQAKMVDHQSEALHQKHTTIFEKSKGNMPFPLDQGFISLPFGKQNHKVLKYVLEENTGIDITANPGTMAFAIQEGIVKSTLYVPGTGYSVIVSHGDYRTIYANLSEIFVVREQMITQGQKIGRVFTQPYGQRTVFHFEVWKTKQGQISQLNPETWIKKI